MTFSWPCFVVLSKLLRACGQSSHLGVHPALPLWLKLAVHIPSMDFTLSSKSPRFSLLNPLLCLYSVGAISVEPQPNSGRHVTQTGQSEIPIPLATVTDWLMLWVPGQVFYHGIWSWGDICFQGRTSHGGHWAKRVQVLKALFELLSAARLDWRRHNL